MWEYDVASIVTFVESIMQHTRIASSSHNMSELNGFPDYMLSTIFHVTYRE